MNPSFLTKRVCDFALAIETGNLPTQFVADFHFDMELLHARLLYSSLGLRGRTLTVIKTRRGGFERRRCQVFESTVALIWQITRNLCRTSEILGYKSESR